MQAFQSNQGTQTNILVDTTGGTAGTVIPVMKLSIDGSGTFTTGNLWNGSITGLGTLPGIGSVSNIGSIGMLNAGTISSLPNLPGGSIAITTGTVNTGTINIGTVVGKDASGAARTGNPVLSGGTDGGGTIYGFLTDTKGQQYLGGGTVSMLNAGTLTTIPNIPGGTLGLVSAIGTIGTLGLGTITGNLGTMGTLGTVQNIGSITNIGQVYNAGTLQGGTINTGTVVNNGGSVQITDNTNIANVVNLGTGSNGTVNQNALLTAGGVMYMAFTPQTANGGTLIAPMEVSNYKYVSIQSGGTLNALISIQQSNIGTLGPWKNINLDDPTSNSNSSTQAGSAEIRSAFISARYLQVIVTAFTSGTVNGTAAFFSYPSSRYVMGAAQQGAWNIGTMGTLGLGTITGNLGTIGTLGAGTVHLAGTVQDNFTGLGTFTITLGTLASSGSVGRQSTIIDNTTNLWPAALIGAQITPGTVTAAGQVNLYLYRSDNGGGPIQDDLTGASDALGTVNNAPLLGVIPISIGTNTMYKAVFDTSSLGHLGPKWGIIVQHALGNPLAVAGSQSITYQSIAPKFS